MMDADLTCFILSKDSKVIEAEELLLLAIILCLRGFRVTPHKSFMCLSRAIKVKR